MSSWSDKFLIQSFYSQKLQYWVNHASVMHAVLSLVAFWIFPDQHQQQQQSQQTPISYLTTEDQQQPMQQQQIQQQSDPTLKHVPVMPTNHRTKNRSNSSPNKIQMSMTLIIDTINNLKSTAVRTLTQRWIPSIIPNICLLYPRNFAHSKAWIPHTAPKRWRTKD